MNGSSWISAIKQLTKIFAYLFSIAWSSDSEHPSTVGEDLLVGLHVNSFSFICIVLPIDDILVLNNIWLYYSKTSASN